MVALKLGSTDISKVYLGSSLASKLYLGSTQIWPSAVAPVSIVGVAGGGATFTMPTHQAGDIIVALAFRATNNVNPTKPAAGGTVPTWNTILNPAGTNSCSCVLVYAVATANNHTSGTFGSTNATVCVVLRGAGATPVGANVLATYSGNTPTAPSVTLTNTDGSSALLHFFCNQGTFAPTNWNNAPPTGYTKQVTSTSPWICVDSKDDTTSDGSVVQLNSGNQGTTGIGISLEIRAH